MSYNEFCQEFGAIINFLEYRSIISCIPSRWKTVVNNNNKVVENTENMILIGEKKMNIICSKNDIIYHALVVKKIDRSKAYRRFSEQLNINEDEWLNIYMLPHSVGVNNRVKESQYKILHNYAASNRLLFKMNILHSLRCNMCNLYEQTLQHLFFTCVIVRNFWFDIVAWLDSEFDFVVTLDLKSVLFGMEKNVKNSFVNEVILYAKYFIANCKYMETYPAADKFVTFLRKNNPVF